jgi:hypothetical protein
MSGNGAYEGEMNHVALFESALRATVPMRPDPAIGTALVPRLAEAARAAMLEAETHGARRAPRAPRSRFALVARVGIAVALIPLVLAGLAFAGVTVPAPARDAFDAVGITLPNQPAEHSHASDHSQGPAHADGHAKTGSSTTTIEKTKGKSEAAHKHALEQQSKAQGKALGHENGKAIGLNGSTPPGQANQKQTAPPSHSNAGGNSATHTTTHTVPQHTTPTTAGNGNANGHANSNGHTK